MKKNFLLLILLVIFYGASAQSADEKKIRSLLAAQTAQWNRGNIEGFMEGYWHSDSLLFVGKNGPKYGFRSALENYKKSYPDTAAMGKLRFDILRTEQLAPDRYFLLGRWTLQRTLGNLQGYFTLLFRKIAGKWVIVADHSS